MRVYKAELNGVFIAIVKREFYYEGVVRKDNQLIFEQTHEKFSALKAILHNEAGKLHPDYFGIGGAINRFLKFFPLGFDDPSYKTAERSYKDKVVTRVGAYHFWTGSTLLDDYQESLLEIGSEADTKEYLRNFYEEKISELEAVILQSECLSNISPSDFRINLLYKYEFLALKEVLSHSGEEFFAAVRHFMAEERKVIPNFSQSLSKMAELIRPYGRASWPLVTILPFLLNPERHMFLKPEVTKNYANRVGHDFSQTYSSEITSETYVSLLSLVKWTETRIADLKPIDGIDVQSFIWVVGKYTDEDLPT